MPFRPFPRCLTWPWLAVTVGACTVESGGNVKEAILEKNKLSPPAWVERAPGVPFENDGQAFLVLVRKRRQSLGLGVQQLEAGLPAASLSAWRWAETQGQVPVQWAPLEAKLLAAKSPPIRRADFYYEKVEGLSEDGASKDVFYNLYLLVALGPVAPAG